MSVAQLKKIRSQRVERIYIELQRLKSSFRQAEIELQQARDEFENYSLWREREERSLFNSLQQSDSFSANTIKNYNLKVESLKLNESQLNNAIPAFEKNLDATKKVLEKVQEKLQIANKDMEKVDEFIDIQKVEDKLIEEAQEENVADELSCFKSSQK
ncbi:MAG: YscO family type III secretion system apparatus protein [Thiotrichaceae bacterium]